MSAEDLNTGGRGSSYFTLQDNPRLSHLSIPGLVPRPSVQIMIRALRILVQVVNEPGGICDGDLTLFRFSSRGIARCCCCCCCRFSRGLGHVLIPEILILHGAGNCRIGEKCLQSSSRRRIPSIIYERVPAVAALWCCREAAHRSLSYADLSVSNGRLITK